jgi:tight adherence protein B
LTAGPQEKAIVNPTILLLLTFLAGTMAVVGVYSILSDLYLRDRNRVARRIDEEFRQRQRDRARQSPLFKAIGELAAEAAAEDDGPRGLRPRLEALIEQSGLSWTVGRLLTLSACLGLGFGTLAWLLSGPLAAAGLAPLGGALPVLYARYKQKVRKNRLLAQLPDAFDLMARVIRAGQTMSQALQAVADEFEAPIAAEFSYCYEQQNLGLAPELSLRDLARRTGLIEVKIFVLAILVQQQTGGNLSEMLEKLAQVVRERFRMLGKIRALTAEGRFQAAVLLVLPPAIFLLILLLNRQYGQMLLDRPALLVAVFVSELFGALWIRKIVNFDF